MASEVKKFIVETTLSKEDIDTEQSRNNVGNMREQPKVTSLIYSPKRQGKNGETKSTKSSHPGSSSSLTHSDAEPKRKTLQILQPSADGQQRLTGGKSPKPKSKKKVRGSSRSRQAKLYTTTKIDTETSSGPETDTTKTNDATSDAATSADETIAALMVQEQAPEKYWELLAEERRKALEETLEENMKLYQVIEDLKAENEMLREKANNTDYFSTMYKIVQGTEIKEEDETT